LPGIISKSMLMVGGILVIMAASYASTNYLIDQEVPTKLFAWTTSFISNRWTFLIVLNLFLLVLGCLLDIFSAIMLVVPLILPIASSYGIDPIHLGIIFLANMQVGYCTPPIGMNLFIAAYRFDKPILRLGLYALPFLVILLLVVLIITYFPWFSMVFTGSLR